MGDAVVEIKHLADCQATYRWRYVSQQGAKESSGSGELFEQYGRRPDDGNSVTDLGSKLLIVVGPYKVPWSCGTADSGWIYDYDAHPALKAYAIEDVLFENFRLGVEARDSGWGHGGRASRPPKELTR